MPCLISIADPHRVYLQGNVVEWRARSTTTSTIGAKPPLNFPHAVQLSSGFRFHVDQLHLCIPAACVTFDVAVVPDPRVIGESK
jgi:hypothetical protein